jgi:hypothetical protein
MAKQLVGRNFSWYARQYRRGQEVESDSFPPDVLKEFQKQGKLIPAGSDKAKEVVNDAEVIRMREVTTQAEQIAAGDIPDGDNKQ